MASTRKKTSLNGSVKFKSIDEYHSSFPKDVQKKLTHLRKIIKQAVPIAKESICYNIPTFKLNNNLVHYAAYKEHIGFYPTSTPIKIFKDDLINFKTSKGAVQFPIDKPLPVALIKKIVEFRVAEDNKTTVTKTIKQINDR